MRCNLQVTLCDPYTWAPWVWGTTIKALYKYTSFTFTFLLDHCTHIGGQEVNTQGHTIDVKPGGGNIIDPHGSSRYSSVVLSRKHCFHPRGVMTSHPGVMTSHPGCCCSCGDSAIRCVVAISRARPCCLPAGLDPLTVWRCGNQLWCCDCDSIGTGKVLRRLTSRGLQRNLACSKSSGQETMGDLIK